MYFTRSGLVVPWNNRFKSLLEFRRSLRSTGEMVLSTEVGHMCEWGILVGGAMPPSGWINLRQATL